MKEKVFCVICIYCIVSGLMGVELQKYETPLDSDLRIISKSVDDFFVQPGTTEFTNRDSRVVTQWEATEEQAICRQLRVSGDMQTTFVHWYLNDRRVALYDDSNVPLWSYDIGENERCIDMLDNGTMMAFSEFNTLKLFNNESNVPIWELTKPYWIIGVRFTASGDSIYVGSYDDINNTSYVECYEVLNTTPIWSVSFDDSMNNLTSSGDRNTLIMTQYGTGIMNMWVLDGSNGSILLNAPSFNQWTPSMSYDGSIIVNGRNTGYVYVYAWNEVVNTYEEQWVFHANGASPTIGGTAVSGDGSTIAVGTLITLGNDQYDGEIYLFNTASPVPLWVYENVGDYVVSVDMSYDGSKIAAASWGPLDNSSADFMLFRRDSNVPVFEINTRGSLECVDMAEDGSFCSTGGKAVHCRIMGWGGMIYNIDCNLGGGFISGNINLEGSDDNSGVKVEVAELPEYFDYTDYDGNFILENVPADTYTVEYSKVGFVSNNNTNVVVLEGESIDLGTIDMLAFGDPPINFVASQAAGITVELTWEEPVSGDPTGYFIYRKLYENEPYPEEPLASTASGELCYTDDTALPLVDYYYVVTAELAGGLQSPYSNQASGWICSGFVVDEISAYEGSTPTIDGTISVDEWDDAFELDTTDFWGSYDNTIQPIGSVIGYYKTNATMTELYVAYIDYNDTALEDHDEVALYIDDNNDGVYSPESEANEGNYWAAYYAAGNQLKFRPIYNTGSAGDVFYLPDPQMEVSIATGYVVYEFMIPIGIESWKINPSADNQSSLAIFLLDDNTPDPHGFDGWWPYDNMNLFDPERFGTITYGAVSQIPPAPTGLALVDNLDETLTLTWEQPLINDFDHFNIYFALNGGNYEIITETIGTTHLYEVINSPALHNFYVTTVNQTGLESVPSDIVEYQSVSSEDLPNHLITKLDGNYPNPFNPTTTIKFSTTETNENTELTIYNLKGQKVKQLVNEQLSAGQHSVVWNGRDDNEKITASGLYFYKMKTGKFQETKKMILLK